MNSMLCYIYVCVCEKNLFVCLYLGMEEKKAKQTNRFFSKFQHACMHVCCWCILTQCAQSFFSSNELNYEPTNCSGLYCRLEHHQRSSSSWMVYCRFLIHINSMFVCVCVCNMGECPVSIFGTLIGHHSDWVKPNRDSTQTIQQFIHENGSNYSPIKWMITVADIKKKKKKQFQFNLKRQTWWWWIFFFDWQVASIRM